MSEGRLVSAGGRVLGVTALADTLEDAVARAYDAVGQVQFENGFCRRDIGIRALHAKEVRGPAQRPQFAAWMPSDRTHLLQTSRPSDVQKH